MARSIWAVTTAENLARYRTLYDEARWAGIDFTRLSKARNAELETYDFSVESILSHL